MNFKFYTDVSETLLYCQSETGEMFAFNSISGYYYWQNIENTNLELFEITEEKAQKMCNGRVYASQLKITKKGKHKIYNSLLKLPNRQINKLIIFSIILGIIVFSGLYFVCFANGKPENFLYFFVGSCIYVFLSIVVDKIFNLSEGEGFFIVLVIGFLLGAFFYG